MHKILIFLLCFCTIFVCFVIPSFADDGVTTRAVPTDLTGLTVTFPNLHTFSRYLGGNISLSGYITYQGSSQTSDLQFSSIYNSVDSASAFNFTTPSISLYEDNYLAVAGGVFVFDNRYGTLNSITFTGGSDSSNSNFIQWLVDNEATFSSLDPLTIPSGYYKLNQLPSSGVPSVGGFSPGIEHLFETPVELFYSSGVVKRYNYFGFVVSQFTDSNNFSIDFTVQLLDIDNSVRVANLTAVDGVCTSQFYGGISNLYFTETFRVDELSKDLILFTFTLDSSFIPDVPDIPDLPDYNPWAYILEMIIEALKVPLFGYFSVWDIFVTICSIFILTWLLKLLAGG